MRDGEREKKRGRDALMRPCVPKTLHPVRTVAGSHRRLWVLVSQAGSSGLNKVEMKNLICERVMQMKIDTALARAADAQLSCASFPVSVSAHSSRLSHLYPFISVSVSVSVCVSPRVPRSRVSLQRPACLSEMQHLRCSISGRGRTEQKRAWERTAAGRRTRERG